MLSNSKVGYYLALFKCMDEGARDRINSESSANLSDYFRESGRSLHLINIGLFFLGILFLFLILDFSLRNFLLGLGAFTIPFGIIYKTAQPAFDGIVQDYFLNLPKEELLVVAKFQLAILLVLVSILVFQFAQKKSINVID